MKIYQNIYTLSALRAAIERQVKHNHEPSRFAIERASMGDRVEYSSGNHNSRHILHIAEPQAKQYIKNIRKKVVETFNSQQV